MATTKTMTRGQTMSAIAVMAVIGAVAFGLVTLGGPSDERHRRMDQRRVEDLRRIGTAVDKFEARFDRLPTSLQELVVTSQDGRRRASLVHAENVRDPATDQLYAYHVGVETQYELCATFQRPSRDEPVQRRYGTFWSHPSGTHCFAFDAATPAGLNPQVSR